MKNPYILLLFLLSCFIWSCHNDDNCKVSEQQTTEDAFLGDWNILFTFTQEGDGSIIRQDTLIDRANFSEKGKGYYHRETFSQDMLYSYYESPNILVLHLFSGDALLHTNHNSKAYDVLTLEENKVILQDSYEYQTQIDNQVVNVKYTEQLELTRIK